MLTEIAYDTNDCIYQDACLVIEWENTTSWRWFVYHLANDLGIDDSKEWTFMTNRQKSLQNVLDEFISGC